MVIHIVRYENPFIVLRIRSDCLRYVSNFVLFARERISLLFMIERNAPSGSSSINSCMHICFHVN